MKLDLQLNIGHIISIVGFLATAIGLLVAVIQMRRNLMIHRADFIRSVTSDLFDDSELRKFFYEIDYEKFKFSKDDLSKFKGSDDERRLDALLYKYDTIAKMLRLKLVKNDDIEFLLFEFFQIMNNKQVLKYLEWLDSEYKKHGPVFSGNRKRPHDNARWLFDNIKNNNF